MDDATLYNEWFIGLGLAGVVVLIAAVLLLLIWLAARRILKLAKAALGIVVTIRQNTNSIWSLQQTNEVAGNILIEAGEIKSHAGLVAEALQEKVIK